MSTNNNPWEQNPWAANKSRWFSVEEYKKFVPENAKMEWEELLPNNEESQIEETTSDYIRGYIIVRHFNMGLNIFTTAIRIRKDMLGVTNLRNEHLKDFNLIFNYNHDLDEHCKYNRTSNLNFIDLLNSNSELNNFFINNRDFPINTPKENRLDDVEKKVFLTDLNKKLVRFIPIQSAIIEFETDKIAIRDSEIEKNHNTFDRIIAALKSSKVKCSLVISGHASIRATKYQSDGTEGDLNMENNYALAGDRATSARNYLIEHYEIESSKISTSNKGISQPRSGIREDDGRQQRVEMTLVFDDWNNDFINKIRW